MSVSKGDRRQSKVEFDNVYFKIYDDATRLCEINFGVRQEYLNELSAYLWSTKAGIFQTVFDIGKQIRIANSIFPKKPEEYVERRLAQDKAIGLCYDLLTKYQLTMHHLGCKDDKYLDEIKNVIYEIKCLKNWRSSDYNRFKTLG